MDSFRYIHDFLGDVRRRLFGVWAARALFVGVAALVLASLVAAFLASLSEGTAGAARTAAWVAALGVVGAVIAAGVVLPRRRYRSERDMARYVGQRAPEIASDLLSSVEIEGELAGAPGFSPELATALAASTADRVRHLDPRALVPTDGVRRAVRWLLLAGAVHALLAVAMPHHYQAGWQRLVTPADPNAIDAVSVGEPLVGDILMTLDYPDYTGRATATLEGSSGDIYAPRGTRVMLETRALRPARRVFLLFEDSHERLPLVPDGDKLRAEIVLEKAGEYRFLLEPPGGDKLVEERPRRIDIEPDRAPQVDLIAPAEELEVSSRRRIELAYSVEDDHGLRELALVWRGPDGKDHRKILPELEPGQRTAQGTYIWDLAEVSLSPGARVPYRLEARDNDNVAGPNVGSSRTYYLRVFSPRERHEAIVEKQEELFEHMVAALGDRLVLPADDLGAWLDAQDAVQGLVLALGQIAGVVKKDPLAPKKLRPELEEMRKRLERLAGQEKQALAEVVARTQRDRDAVLKKNEVARLVDSGASLIEELERDVLAFADWIERQKLEGALAIADEIRQLQTRLEELLAEYKRTQSPELKAEIERQIRELEQRIAELMERLAQLEAETEERFVNHEALDTQEALSCLQKVRELFAEGKLDEAEKELERCAGELERQARALEQSLKALRDEKFVEEERALGEILDEVGDLEEAESALVKEADEILDRYRERAAEVAADEDNPHRERARKLLEKLTQKLAEVPPSGLTPFGQEEFDYVQKRLEDVGRMLEEGDLAEALAMARQAEVGVKTLEADLEDDLSDGEPWSRSTGEALDKVEKAAPLAERLVKELEGATPPPGDIMSPDDRRRLEKLRRQQRRIKDRTEKLAGKVQQRLKDIPGNAGEMAKEELGEAAKEMGRAQERFQSRDPRGGRDEARGAAERLSNLRKGMQRAARPTSVGRRPGSDEPVRIPGSEEYRAPEAFREAILEAMKEKAPDRYQELVKRYYEELVK